MKKILVLLMICLLTVNDIYSQGLNHNYLVGYTGIDTNVTNTRAILGFDLSTYTTTPSSFKMPFRGAQANISDSQGNLLMYTNGCWIADATGDTMQNGAGLNPGTMSDSWCDESSGNPLNVSSVFLPFPGDSTKYILFHLTGDDTDWTIAPELLYSVIDITQNGNLGAVVQKNQIALQGVLVPGFSVCKHANGRDWWIITLEPGSDVIHKQLLTPLGFIQFTSQAIGLSVPFNYSGSLLFSPDGTKLAHYYKYYVGSDVRQELRLLDFDRCNGMFSNLDTCGFNELQGGYCLSFSPNSKYVYFGTLFHLFQVKVDTANIAANMDTIATYDGYCYPLGFTCANFFYSYLAANGKIYISPNNGIHLTYVNQPDSDGINCDVKLHALQLSCYAFRNNVFHPNYYLGPVIGSVCDSLHVGINELEIVRNVSLYPNPSHDGSFSISYLLPQNKSGILKVFDLMGKEIYKMNLPQWSTLQNLSLPFLINGVYNVSIHSGESSLTKRLIILK